MKVLVRWATIGLAVAFTGWLIWRRAYPDETKVQRQTRAFVVRMHIDGSSVSCAPSWPPSCSAITTAGYPVKFWCTEDDCYLGR